MNRRENIQPLTAKQCIRASTAGQNRIMANPRINKIKAIVLASIQDIRPIAADQRIRTDVAEK